MLSDPRHRERQGSRAAVLTAGVLFVANLAGPAVFAQGGSVWVEPPPLESTATEPDPGATPEVPAPAAPRTTTPPVTEPLPARATEPGTEPTRRSRLSRPKPQEEPAPALARRAPTPGPRLARKHAVNAVPRPSFKCGSAKSSVERAICADPVLAAKDRRMALLYERVGGSRYGPVDRSQWSWLAARNRCGRVRGLAGCLHRAYDDRMAELSLR